MTKIPHFFLAGAIPKDRVGDVLEAMYAAGAKQLDIRPLVPLKRGTTEALPAPNGESVRAKVLEFAILKGEFTGDDLRAAVHSNSKSGLSGALHALKKRKLIRASGSQMNRRYTYTGKKES